jgi:phosphoribosylaminoimidazolecarboxamide formyltransferase/IMP cyclohydrolase
MAEKELTSTDQVTVRNALISVFDKTGLDKLIPALKARDVRVFSTGGTATYLEELGMPVTRVESLTQFPEMMEGRVKTLHPKVFGGILARRYVPKDLEEASAHGIPMFDLVVVNLYPFASHLGKDVKTQSSFIDIGGPSLLRGAAKNHVSVAVLSDAADYGDFLSEFEAKNGATTVAFRKRLAAKTFARTAAYDAMIAGEWTEQASFPAQVSLTPFSPLRYGENPHQKAGFTGTPDWEVFQGKELSYNNLLDAEAATALVREFTSPAAVIVKHNNPCGVACPSTTIPKAQIFTRAFEADNQSAFGGIVALNFEVDGDTAKAMSPIFLEVILAPEFSAEAREILGAKKNLRLIKWAQLKTPVKSGFEVRKAMGGWLVQETDAHGAPTTKPVTEKTVAPGTEADLNFAWLVCKHVRSNAIVIAQNGVTLGIGAGQMSRVDAVGVALEKAKGKITPGAILASDAFFPFRDNIDRLKDTGIGAIIQPGGSQRDAEVIQACNEQGLAMVFTGERHFRH